MDLFIIEFWEVAFKSILASYWKSFLSTTVVAINVSMFHDHQLIATR